MQSQQHIVFHRDTGIGAIRRDKKYHVIYRPERHILAETANEFFVKE